MFAQEIGTAKGKIDDAVRSYTSSMGFLSATMTSEVLRRGKRHDEIEKRHKILKWLWDGNYWEIHKSLRERRVPHTGNWFLDSLPFKDWREGKGSTFLICPGIRTNPLR